ncbi:MAG TPA: heterodisulfide reductase-related iron-sulfur binding cluster, partial [Candidatus Udaeobacter sp.]|nr:heterodisulfide reductase-related iron-sulfur binding cluster [Candidatus Udaeobacter sp.]
HLGRGCGIYEPPRTILHAMPGVELVEMERNQRWAWCCGGGGGVPESYPELAQWNAEDRMREAKATGAELVLTSSALCQRSFAGCSSGTLPTQDLLEFVAHAVDDG